MPWQAWLQILSAAHDAEQARLEQERANAENARIQAEQQAAEAAAKEEERKARIEAEKDAAVQQALKETESQTQELKQNQIVVSIRKSALEDQNKTLQQKLEEENARQKRLIMIAAIAAGAFLLTT